MERLRGENVNGNIHTTMETWLDAIKKVQCRRREELINASNRHQDMIARIETYRVQEDKGNVDQVPCFLFTNFLLPFKITVKNS